MVTVRLFAAVAEAAGRDELDLDLQMVFDPGATVTVESLKRALIELHDDTFERVLRQCTVVVNGKRTSDAGAVPSSALVDVLPPFAGG